MIRITQKIHSGRREEITCAPSFVTPKHENLYFLTFWNLSS
jgi:hypothetical protein